MTNPTPLDRAIREAVEARMERLVSGFDDMQAILADQLARPRLKPCESNFDCVFRAAAIRKDQP